MEKEQREQLKAVIASVYKGESQPLLDHMHPNYVTHTPGRSRLAGDFFGEEHYTVHVRDLRRHTQGTFKVAPMGDIVMDDEWAMVPVMVTADRDDMSLKTAAFGVWRIEDGKIAEHWEMNYDQHAFDKFIDSAKLDEE